jgi:toxin HigB-1
MIVTFGDRTSEDLYHGRNTARVRRFPKQIMSVAIRKLDMLNAATELLDLRSPPGNRLETLEGNLQGFHSIRVNDQWRIVFRWRQGEARDVRLVDYH